MAKIFRFDEAMNFVNMLYDNGMNEYGLKILIEVPSYDILKKIDEEFFYRMKTGEEYVEKGPDTDVIVNIGGVTFIYTIKSKDNDGN